MKIINEIIKDSILEIHFDEIELNDKSIEIISLKTNKVHFIGNINGKIKSACYFVGDWPKGKYQIKHQTSIIDFQII